MSQKNDTRRTLFSLLTPYKGILSLLLLFALLSNALNLLIPKLIQTGIDDFEAGAWSSQKILVLFSLAILLIFLFTYLQSITQTFASERVARDLRTQFSAKIAEQRMQFIQEKTPAKLLTNLTSDIDAVKQFVAQAIVSIISSVILIAGASVLLLNINLRLGLIVLLIIPVIASSFFFVFKKVRHLFKQSQEVIDWLNKVINESILGAALIRVLNAQFAEANKFLDANTEARNLGLSILRLFALLIPIIVLTANLSRLAVLAVGGSFVIDGDMSLGELAAFNSYIAMLIFPILVIGFMSNAIARASASFQRIQSVLTEPDFQDQGTIERPITGHIRLENVSLRAGEKTVLRQISFEIKAHTRTAIIGPTAAGKTQLFYVLTTLQQPDEGRVFFDDIALEDYRQKSLLRQIGFVFQDSILFHLSLRENIAFDADVSEEDLWRAIDTAELRAFIESLPDGLDTIVSERGSSLSGGQKQRIMLARALAIKPKLLLLDDFTARVDTQTDARIRKNLREHYPDMSIIAITQKIEDIKDYDQILLLMQGELVAQGNHEELMRTSLEYLQIEQSQKSTTSLS